MELWAQRSPGTQVAFLFQKWLLLNKIKDEEDPISKTNLKNITVNEKKNS